MDIEKTQLLVGGSVYWPNMNTYMELTGKQCIMCLNYQHKQPQERALHYETPCRAWEVVGADIFMINSQMVFQM